MIPQYGESHKKIADWLKNSKDEDAQLAGRILSSLREERTSADYDMDLDPTFTHATTKTILPRAQKIIELIDRANQQTMKDGITRYLQTLGETCWLPTSP